MATRGRVNSSLRAQHMPSHFRHIEGTFANSRGQNLSYLALFPPADAPIRALVLYLHGIGDHSRRYFYLYKKLCTSGFGVFAYDLVSHGASDSDHHGLRAHSERFQHFVDDTNAFLTLAKSKLFAKLGLDASTEAPLPLILSGMSLGTLVGLHTILSGHPRFQGVVLVPPALLVEMTTILRLQAVFARPLSTLVPKARIVPGVNGDFVCRDQAYLDDFRADPLTVSEPVTVRMGAETLKAMELLEADRRVQEPGSVLGNLPMLMMMGSNDKVTSLELAQVFFNRLAAPDKEFKIFDGFFHVLFDDPECEAVFDHLEKWLIKRFPVVPKRGDEADDIEFKEEEETVGTNAEVGDTKTGIEGKRSTVDVEGSGAETVETLVAPMIESKATIVGTTVVALETVKVEAVETGEISVKTKDNLEVKKVERGDAFVVEPKEGVSNIIEKNETAVETVVTMDMAVVAETKVSADVSGKALKTEV